MSVDTQEESDLQHVTVTVTQCLYWKLKLQWRTKPGETSTLTSST